MSNTVRHKDRVPLLGHEIINVSVTTLEDSHSAGQHILGVQLIYTPKAVLETYSHTFGHCKVFAHTVCQTICAGKQVP